MISLLTESVTTLAASSLLATAVVTPAKRKRGESSASGTNNQTFLTQPLPQRRIVTGENTDSNVVTLPPPARKLRTRPAHPRRQPSATHLVDLDEAPESLPGLFGDLEMLFRQRLASDPRNVDIRFKLLEVAYTVGNAEVFMTEYLILREQLTDETDPRVGTMQGWGKDLMPEHPLFRSCSAQPRTEADSQVARRKSNRHYDSLGYRRAQPALEALRAKYTAQWKGLEKAIYAMALDFDASRELGRWARKGNGNKGAKIVVRHGNAGAFHPVSFNARAQVVIAERMGFQHVVTAARSIEHALAVVRGIEDAAGKMSCEIFIDAVLASAAPKAVEQLQVEGVVIHWPDANLDQDDPDTDSRVLALNKMLANPGKNFYVCDLGSGPAPYSGIIRDIQTVMGRVVQGQLRSRGFKATPDAVVTCAESGQSGISMLLSFLDKETTRMYCIEPNERNGDFASREAIDMRARREHDWLRKANRVKYCVAPARKNQPSRDQGATGIGNQDANRSALALAASIAAGMPEGSTVLVQLAANGARKS